MDAFIISAGQDTNGQNARFVRAAEKYGADVLRAFAIGSDDPAGVIGRYQEAAEKGDRLRIRSAHRVSHYFEFPHDLVWEPKTESLIRTLIRQADVVHLNNSFRAMTRFHIRKPMLLHHHGSMFRNAPTMMGVAKGHKMVQAVSTVDLMQADPTVLHWLPSAYDIDELQGLGNANRREPDGRVRIVHAPTNRALKHTDLLAKILGVTLPPSPPQRPWVGVELIHAPKTNIDLVIVQGQTNRRTMIEKAKADIVYDQIAFGYGCNAIEAWGMGVPVIAGGQTWTLGMMERMWGTIPFAEADEETLRQTIKDMAKSADMRAEYAERGLAHVRKYHDERPALDRLMDLYVEAIEKHAKPRIVGKAVQFQYAGRPPMAVTDIEEVARLRGMAKRRPLFIKEVEETA